MPEDTEAQRLARAALTVVAEPGDPVLGVLLRSCPPTEIIAALTAGRAPAPLPTGPARAVLGATRLDRALGRWAARLGGAPTEAQLAAWRRTGVRLVVPGDAEWPGQLDILGDARPWGLWVRGNADLRYACLRSVAVVGTRAATAYGAHVAGEISVALAERGWTLISGGAYGIDSAVHRAALAVGGVTIAVLACGLDQVYPPGHDRLFRQMCESGAVVSEWPPGRSPTRHAFLVRNRVITALSRGTLVVEAARRSGALNTARHARDQRRPLMAVPGPVTSEQSAGCHEIIREWGAVCVTGAQDVVDLLSFTDEPARPERGPVLPRDELDPVQRRVLEAVPAKAGQGPARIAVAAGVDFDTVMACLGALAAAGFTERCNRGWRLRRPPLDEPSPDDPSLDVSSPDGPSAAQPSPDGPSADQPFPDGPSRRTALEQATPGKPPSNQRAEAGVADADVAEAGQRAGQAGERWRC